MAGLLPVKVVWVETVKLPPQPYIMVERPLAHGNKPRGGVFSEVEIAKAGNYAVPQQSLTADDHEAHDWSFTTTGDYVRVPLLPYRTEGRSLAELLQLGMMLGFRALSSFALCKQREPRRVLLLLGNDVLDKTFEDGPAFEAMVGLAVVY